MRNINLFFKDNAFMSLNKKILLVALSMSLHGASICMENQDNWSTPIQRVSEMTVVDMEREHFYDISDFVQDPNPKYMESLGHWLNEERKKASSIDDWDETIENLISCVTTSYRNDPLRGAKTIAVCKVVQEVAERLQPGQDCSQLLIEHVQEAVEKTTREWKESLRLNIK